MSDIALNDLQFDVIDCLYFVEPYANILEDVGKPEPIVRDELRTLIDRGYVNVLIFEESSGDYVKTSIFDSDNMQDYFYLASKDGLLKHNGF
ncbi:MAG: hypothetical protein AB8F95_05025 [Bacteroidia bacterium]